MDAPNCNEVDSKQSPLPQAFNSHKIPSTNFSNAPIHSTMELLCDLGFLVLKKGDKEAGEGT